MHARPAAPRIVERPDIEGRLPGADRVRKSRQLPASVGVPDFEVEAGKVSRMQDHQPASICQQWTARPPFRGEREGAVGADKDGGREFEAFAVASNAAPDVNGQLP